MASDSKFKQTKIAMVYDFDGTLSPEAMQHYGVLPALGMEPAKFWEDVRERRKELEAEELLVYMRKMLELAEQQAVKLDRDSFKNHGKTIKFFDGVEGWFDRINEFVSQVTTAPEINVEHYIISSGLKEMIEGCSISRHFKKIYACEFLYDEYGRPKWPARVISDTSKTQYLFRINKGVLNVNESINSHMPLAERSIPFDNMIYFGDGDTDVPSMAVVMANGGHAVAVHKPGEAEAIKCSNLKKANRIDYYCEADYSEGSVLDEMVKNTLRILVSRIELRIKVAKLKRSVK